MGYNLDETAAFQQHVSLHDKLQRWNVQHVVPHGAQPLRDARLLDHVVMKLESPILGERNRRNLPARLLVGSDETWGNVAQISIRALANDTAFWDHSDGDTFLGVAGNCHAVDVVGGYARKLVEDTYV